MKIISWNCNQKFREKFKLLEEFDADILIIQECENPAESKLEEYKKWAQNYLWVGDNKHKGLGIFAKPEIELKKLGWSDEGYKLFLPFIINGEFDVVAVWTKAGTKKSNSYISQLWNYIQLNKGIIEDSKPMIIGDFNSNALWDKERKLGNHSDVVNALKKFDIHSLNHAKQKEPHGAETQPTIYMYRNIEKPYHIDYAFLPNSLLEDADIEIGKAEVWLQHSDHMPLFLTL